MKTTIVIVLSLITISLSGQIPILPDFYADPSARLFGDSVWIYPSHDIPGSTYWDMTDWHTFSSSDMKSWTDHGIILSLADISWAGKYAWAADCIERNRKYYFYFTADFQVGVAVSNSPAGPFKDALGTPLIAKNEGRTTAMDPCIFIDDDGQAYLYYGNGGLCVVKLKEDMITKDGEPEKIDAKFYHEGIWVHKKDGKYYLSYPSWRGDMVANLLEYSIGDSPVGPFEHAGIILDNHSRNVHHSIVEIRGQWYLFYHIQGPSPYERRVCMEKLQYTEDGKIVSLHMSPVDGNTTISAGR